MTRHQPTKLVHCSLQRHGQQILDILNDAIVHSTAVYDYKPRPASSMGPWFESKVAVNYPVLGLEAEDGTLLGFATYGSFRAWPAYKYTVEHSLYVRREVRGQGLDGELLSQLVAVAQEHERHVLIAGIDAMNEPSIKLHEKHGFMHAGTIRACGFKFGRWLDLAFYQLVLATPAHPADDP